MFDNSFIFYLKIETSYKINVNNIKANWHVLAASNVVEKS